MEAEFWDRAIEEHTRAAVGGDEPGGLVASKEWAPPSHVLRNVWADVGTLVGGDIPAGPEYPTAADNPPEYKGKESVFIPGHIHDCVDEWRVRMGE